MSRQARLLLPVLVTALVAPLLAVFRFGYAFGISDQDEFLPLLRARIEPPLLEHDWFVTSQLDSFHIRSGFVSILEIPARLLGVELATGLLWVAAALSLAVSIHLIARKLGAAPFGAFVAAVLALALLPRWTLGGNAAWSSMLVPSMLAWALCLPAVLLILHRRALAAGVLVGVAAWVQILVAAQAGAFILAALLWRDRSLKGDAVQFAVPALLFALPLGVLLFLSGAGLPSESFDVLARFRAPHHYLPSAFPAADLAQFAVLGVGGGLALRRTRLARRAPSNRLLAGIFLAMGLAIVLGVAAWMTGFNALLALQPFKASVLASVLLCCGLGAALPEPRIPVSVWTAGSVAAIVGIVLLARGHRIADRPVVSSGPLELAAAARWAASETAPDARFMVPPSSTGFRFASGRAVVANFKAYPFSAGGTAEWLQRMVDIGGLPSSEGGTLWLRQLDTAYAAMSAARAHEVANKYEAGFVVRTTPFSSTDSLFVLREQPGTAFIYEVRP
ncbi:MAG: hypothetical protein JJ896_09110 [Rhodothermales bacterium]|nr:hypothetical protein [Rhodothermales bacterium]MBO6779796.1 hypothetical protein [Rhodothermales bacterium]